MKPLLLLAFFALGAKYIYAQQRKIAIVITDEKGQPLLNTTGSLYAMPEGKALGEKVFQKVDSLMLEIGKNYELRLTAVGKKKTIVSLDSTLTSSITIVMKTEDAVMDAVVIRSKKPLIKEEDDKTIVDATSIASSSSNAFEVLEKTPGAIIDSDGNVYLNSTTPATIYINGREMKMSAADVSALLKSLPANSISKIEVLRNPSAKYDASSSGGILNIVLKKGVKIGNNGSINLAYFQGVYPTATGGITYNHQGDTWNYYTSYQYTYRNNFEKIISNRRFSLDSLMVKQEAYTTYPSRSNYLSGGADRTFKNGIGIGIDTRLTHNDNRSEAGNNIQFVKTNIPNPLATNGAQIQNKNNSFFWTNTFNLKYKWDSSGSEWNNVIEYTKNNFQNKQVYNNFYTTPFAYRVEGDGDNRTEKNQFAIQSDLTLKLPASITVETGFKLNFGRSENKSEYFKDTGTRFVDLFQTNTYTYSENIHAAYLQASKTFFGFIIKPGLRFEHTSINGIQSVPTDTSFSIRRNDVFPYLFVKHKLFNIFKQTLMASAIVRRTIKRPYYEALNPFPKFIDQYLYEVGNPALKPQFTTNYELSVTFNDIPVASFGINQSKDIFSGVIYQNDTTKIAYRTFDNLGKNKEIYARLIAGIPPGGKYFFYFGALYNFNAYRGFYQNQPFNYDRGSYTFFTYHEYKCTKTLTLSMQGFLRTKGLQQFYELETFGGMFLSANKSIMKRKANIIVSLNDALQTNRVAFTFNRNNQEIEGKRINDTRRLGITFRYNFGIKPKEEKKAGFDNAPEAANP